jgi:CBS domain-containing protein
MTSDLRTCGENDTLDTVHDLMTSGSFRGVPVVDEGNGLIGIITESDLREHVGYLDRTRVSGAMTPRPITVAPDAPVSSAARLLLENKFYALPVLQEGRLVGIVTASDLLRVLVDDLPPKRS